MANFEWEIRRKTIGQTGVNVLICDDESDSRDRLREELLRSFAKINVNANLSIFGSPEEMGEEDYAGCNFAFLDIDFDSDDYNGIDIARRLRQSNQRALVFFVTNYIDYAPEGYEVHAFRYILKRDMHQVLDRYILQAVEKLAEGGEYLRISDGGSVSDIALSDIEYLEVMDHYVSIHYGDQVFTLGATLSEFEREMEGHGFLRIHKSYLVNMGHIRKFTSRCCLLKDGNSLAVSEKNYSRQKQKYLLWRGMK